MINLNLLLKRSLLISGNFDGEKIIKTRLQHFLHLFAISLYAIESLIALIVFCCPELKFHFQVLHLTEGLSQKMWTFCTIFVHLEFMTNHIFFYKYCSNPKKIQFLDYLFRTNEALTKRFKIDEKIAKKIQDMLSLKKKYGLIYILHDLLPAWYFFIVHFLVFRAVYLAYKALLDNKITLLKFCLLSIPTSLLLDISFLTEAFSTATLYLIFLLEDLNSKLRSQIKYQAKHRINLNGNKKGKKIEIEEIMQQASSIFRFHKSTQDLANKSISRFYLCIIIMALYYPYMMLFKLTDFIFKLALILIYSINLSCLCYTIVWANSNVSKKLKEFNDLKFSYQRYSDNTRMNIKLLHPVEAHREDGINFNANGFFQFTNHFFISYIIETFSTVFLLYQMKNI